MKAEERHRLAENELARGLKRLATNPRRPPNILLVMIGLLAVVMVVYWYWSSTASNRVARAWVSYFQNRDGQDAPASLVKGPAGHAVQLAQADAAYSRAVDRLFTDPQNALKDFTEIGQQYANLSTQASNNDLQLRSLIGAGRAYESAGQVPEAVKYYDSVLTKFGNRTEWKDHPLVKEAREHKDKLASGEGSLSNLYATWVEKMKQVTTTDLKPPTLPTFPDLNIPLPPSPEKK